MARPRKEIDWEELDKLCVIQATRAEIACWFDVSEDTIDRHMKEKYGMSFAAYYEQKKGTGKISLRRKMFQMAIAGDRVMCIWLSKNYLGFADKQEIKQETKQEVTEVDRDFDRIIDRYVERRNQKAGVQS